MAKPRPYVVVLNLALAAIFSLGVAFFPYLLSSSGEGLYRFVDVFSAIKDACRISAGMALSSFYIPVAIGFFSLASMLLACIRRFDDKLVLVLTTLTFISVALVLVSSLLVQSVHTAVIALIPIGFALVSGRRWSVQQK